MYLKVVGYIKDFGAKIWTMNKICPIKNVTACFMCVLYSYMWRCKIIAYIICYHICDKKNINNIVSLCSHSNKIWFFGLKSRKKVGFVFIWSYNLGQYQNFNPHKTHLILKLRLIASIWIQIFITFLCSFLRNICRKSDFKNLTCVDKLQMAL